MKRHKPCPGPQLLRDVFQQQLIAISALNTTSVLVSGLPALMSVPEMLTVLFFQDTTGEAEYWATLLGDDGRQYENFVLDFRGRELSFDQRRLGIDVLFSHRDWF
jgi:hypothetical protein